MTNEELAEARRLCEGATPGPWESEPDSDSVGVSDAIFKERGYGLLAGADHPGTAAFIAASRTLVPRLLDEGVTTRAEIAKVMEALVKLREWCGDGPRPPGHRDLITRGMIDESVNRLVALEATLDGGNT